MRKLVIIGAGELGREIYSWIKLSMGASFEIIGFVDDVLSSIDQKGINIPIISTVSEYKPSSDEYFICAIGGARSRLATFEKLKQRGASSINIVHPSAHVSDFADLGEGCIVFPNCYIANNAKIGNAVLMNFSSSVGHDAIIGNGCTLSAHVDITGRVNLGEEVQLGSQASVIPGISVGDRAIIGAGSIAMRKVKADTTVVGVPAKRLI